MGFVKNRMLLIMHLQMCLTNSYRASLRERETFSLFHISPVYETIFHSIPAIEIYW